MRHPIKHASPIWLRRLAVALLFLFWPQAASADVTRLYARPGETVVVAHSLKSLELTGKSSRDVRLTIENPVAGQSERTSVITYTAPDKPAGGSEEVIVTYKEEAAERSAFISVESTPVIDAGTLAKAGAILTAMLVVAVVLESAFAVIFNWRVFLEFFDGRGVRTLVMLAGALFVVLAFDKDFIASLFDAYMGFGQAAEPRSTWGTTILTTLVLAGGSAGVNALMVALKLRDPTKAENIAERPAPTKAWVAIKIGNVGDGDFVEVLDTETSPAPADTERLMGLAPAAGIGRRLRKYFWRDRNRVPMSRGFEVDPGTAYAFVIRCMRKSAASAEFFDVMGTKLDYKPPTAGAASSFATTLEPQPRSYVFAKGAIIDFYVDLPSPAPKQTP